MFLCLTVLVFEEIFQNKSLWTRRIIRRFLISMEFDGQNLATTKLLDIVVRFKNCIPGHKYPQDLVPATNDNSKTFKFNITKMGQTESWTHGHVAVAEYYYVPKFNNFQGKTF